MGSGGVAPRIARIRRKCTDSQHQLLLLNPSNPYPPNNPRRGSAAARYASRWCYCPNTMANTSGATMLASDSMMNLGVSMASLPHVIFSFGTAPEYDPYDVVESLI